MNERIKHNVWLILSGLLLLSSCVREDEVGEEIVSGAMAAVEEEVVATVRPFVFDDATRVGYEINDATGALFSWSEDDALGVFAESEPSQQVKYQLDEGAGKSYAVFETEGDFCIESGVGYAAYYPYAVNENFDIRALQVNYENQEQTGDAQSDHVGAYDYLVSGVTVAGGHHRTNFEFSHLGCIFRFQLTMPEADYLDSLYLISVDGTKQFMKEGTYDFEHQSLEPVVSSDTFALALKGIFAQAGNTVTLYAMMAPGDYTKWNVKVISSRCNYTAEIDPVPAVAGKAYRYATPLTVEAIGAPPTVTTVDLALPSGMLWASCNLGAAYPEEYGYFFAWGETAPKTLYTLGTYKYGDDNKAFTKYNSKDKKTQLDAKDDAASVIWRDGWRMPTLAECQELVDHCQWQQEGRMGPNGFVRGFKVTGKNGQSIFLPLSGLYDYISGGAKIDYRNQGMWYWSSTVQSGYIYAYGFFWLYNDMPHLRPFNHEREDGHSIRAVRGHK